MKTPETTAGYLTENIMCRVRSKLPELPTHEYNRIYEAVLGELQCHVLPERQEASARHSNVEFRNAASGAPGLDGGVQ